MYETVEVLKWTLTGLVYRVSSLPKGVGKHGEFSEELKNPRVMV